MSRGSSTIQRVVAGHLCSGCGLCASLSNGAVSMQALSPGYARPVQRAYLDASTERTIADTCPGAVVEPWPENAPVHPYWGPCLAVATGHASDPVVRFRASSGGALTALLIHALKTGMIDRALQIAADPEHPTRNRTVISRTEGEIAAVAGSRYAASSPLEQIEDQLLAGGRFAFVGKPCDVSALRRLARIDPRIDRHIPLLLSFFCAGVPSHNAADRILDAVGAPKYELAAFRYRGYGWPGQATATLHDGRTLAMNYEDSWGGILSKEVQFRCKICPDAVGGVADVACGDAWYRDEHGHLSFKETEGRSLIVSRTAAGDSLLTSAVRAGELEIETLDVSQIDWMQPSQARRKRLAKSRMLALTVTMQAKPDVAGTRLDQAAKEASFGEQLRSFLGAVRRVFLGRRLGKQT